MGEVQVFHDHVLVKEPGTTKPTPWHQNGPYCFVDGPHTVSFWSPLDPVREASLCCVAGLHLWPRPVLPKRWLAGGDFFPDKGQYMPVPVPVPDGVAVLEWEMEPGDAVAFDYRTLHGARGNKAATRRRASPAGGRGGPCRGPPRFHLAPLPRPRDEGWRAPVRGLVPGDLATPGRLKGATGPSAALRDQAAVLGA